MKIRRQVVPPGDVNHLMHQHRLELSVAQLLAYALGQQYDRGPHSPYRRLNCGRYDRETNVSPDSEPCSDATECLPLSYSNVQLADLQSTTKLPQPPQPHRHQDDTSRKPNDRERTKEFDMAVARRSINAGGLAGLRDRRGEL